MTFVVALLVARAGISPPLMQFRGLDRLYFMHVGDAEALEAPAEVAALLPATLPASRGRRSSGRPADDEVSVRDFPVPLAAARRTVVFRQVIDARHPRISELWLALYDGSTRSDVWHFQAYPNPDGKLLPNYWVESIRRAPGGVSVRLRGLMVRPQGAWWATGKVVTLAADDGALRFAHVRNAFGFRHQYDLGDDAEPPTDVRTERDVGGRFEERDIEPAPEDVMKACGLVPDDPVSGAWEKLEAIAQCVTRAPGTTVSSRTPQEPSFAERGFPPKN